MVDSHAQHSAEVRRLDAETRKFQAEAYKLAHEVAAARGAQIRAWIVSCSVVIGIGASTVGIHNTLSEVALRNHQLALESQVKSNELFLNQVLDRMSGVKTVYREVAESTGGLVLRRQDEYGSVIQVGSYAAAVSLACRFENLRLSAQAALTFQLVKNPLDRAAKSMLQRIKDGCPPGWETLSGEEEENWISRGKQLEQSVKLAD